MKTVAQIFLVIGLFVLAGCGVSKDQYEKSIQGANDLQKQLQEAKTKMSDMEKENTDLKTSIVALKNENAAGMDTLQKEVDALKKTNESLAKNNSDRQKALDIMLGLLKKIDVELGSSILELNKLNSAFQTGIKDNDYANLVNSENAILQNIILTSPKSLVDSKILEVFKVYTDINTIIVQRHNDEVAAYDNVANRIRAAINRGDYQNGGDSFVVQRYESDAAIAKIRNDYEPKIQALIDRGAAAINNLIQIQNAIYAIVQ